MMLRNAGQYVILLALLAGSGRVVRLDAQAIPDTVSFHFVAVDLRVVVQGVGRYLDKPLLSVGIPQVPVTFETPLGMERRDLPALLRVLAAQQGLELVEDSVAWRLHPKPPEQVTSLGQVAGLGSGGPVQLFVIRLRHARAPEIAAVVNQLFGGGGEFSGRSGISRTGLSDQLRPVPPAVTEQAPPAGAAAPRGQAGSVAGQVTIVPDEVTNSLLIRASQNDFDVIKGAVDQLDIRPLQVLIEVMFVESRRGRGFSLSSDLSLPPQPVGGGTVSAQAKGGGVGDLVVNLLRVGGGDVNAILRTAENRGEVEVLSRPVIIAANNTEAYFLVGDQRPFISQSRTLSNDNADQVQTIEYKDVGTRLTVLPTINHDGYVSLEILQEVNQATGDEQFGAPIISSREAHTQVLVKDGQTIVLGGLRDRQRDRSSHGIPLLHRLPLIGGLFGASSDRATESELYLFLTPRILRTDEDVEQATAARMPAHIEGQR